MSNQIHVMAIPIAANIAPGSKHCATPGCRHDANEHWDDAGLLCADCVIEVDLYDRDGRWDDVQVPGTRTLLRSA
jgi:hypothetical protein